MQYGRPVVSSNTTCLPEVYKDAACFFDPTESKDMAKKIDEVLSDTELQQKLVNNGHKLLKHYSWKKMAQQTLAVYQETIGLK
jgi:glycosyltransferase involved in cell wall biosynthesis